MYSHCLFKFYSEKCSTKIKSEQSFYIIFSCVLQCSKLNGCSTMYFSVFLFILTNQSCHWEAEDCASGCCLASSLRVPKCKNLALDPGRKINFNYFTLFDHEYNSLLWFFPFKDKVKIISVKISQLISLHLQFVCCISQFFLNMKTL